MSKARIGGVAIIVFLSLLVGRAQDGPALPGGAMKDKVATACTECHESRIILQQRLSKAGWTKEVDKMIKWGAVVDAKDRDAFIDYLSSNFPPDKPSDPVTITRNGDKDSKAGK